MLPQDVSWKAVSSVKWKRISASPEFRDLLALKRVFVLPALAFFLIYYFALLAMIGFAPRVMVIHVFGSLNVAYLFALSQFVVGWTIAWLYLKASAKFDQLARDILEKVKDGGE
ncbi:MAG TPA: DUF485 domain-containing protein [Terriglobales bacterium]|nr:DUF485 domain-containing protein [Terriglobales bacterium]